MIHPEDERHVQEIEAAVQKLHEAVITAEIATTVSRQYLLGLVTARITNGHDRVEAVRSALILRRRQNTALAKLSREDREALNLTTNDGRLD